MKLSQMQKTETKNSHAKSINAAYEELKQCSSDELMKRLCAEIEKQKKDGVFDCDGLLNSIEKIKIYLPKETYENMVKIINNLK